MSSHKAVHHKDAAVVVFCIEELSVGGAEQMLVVMANGFVKRGWAVHMVCLRRAGELASRLNESVQLHVLNKKPGLDIKLRWRLRKCIKEIRPDVINAHLWVANLWTRLSLSKRQVPIIVTEHSRDSWKPAHYRWLDRQLASRTTRMVAVSRDTADFYINTIGLRERLIVVINNGVDTALYANGNGSKLRKAWIGHGVSDVSADVPEHVSSDVFNHVSTDTAIQTRQVLLGTVGRLVPAKNHQRLIDACATLISDTSLSEQVEITLKIVGEGPERDRLQQHIDAQGLGHRISLAGARHDIPDVLSAFDVFVLSSDREGHPLTALEAQAAGTPVVLTNAGGSSEAIAREAGKSGGELVECSAESLSNAIRTMILNPQRLQERGLFARGYAHENFDKQQMLDKYELLFRAAIEADE